MSHLSPSRLLAALGASAALAVATLAAAPAALAHDSLRSSTPGDGTTVATAPEAVSLGFSEEPLELGAQVVVTGPDGQVLSEGSPQVAGVDVVQGLGADRPAGTYTVDWRVTSSDGHPIEGTVTFTAEGAVGASPSQTPTAAPSTTSAAPASEAPSPSATETVSAAPASATTDGSGGGGISGATVGWTIAAGAAGAALGVVLVRARRRASGS